MKSLLDCLRTLLILGRVSNLPTVWSNLMVGWIVTYMEIRPDAKPPKRCQPWKTNALDDSPAEGNLCCGRYGLNRRSAREIAVRSRENCGLVFAVLQFIDKQGQKTGSEDKDGKRRQRREAKTRAGRENKSGKRRKRGPE